MRRVDLRYGAALFVFSLMVYGLTTYGGVRSPDSEIVFRTCEALATEGSWAVEPLELDPGFGVAPGRDGKQYSIFGPLESIVCVPVYWIWEATGWSPTRVSPSPYVDEGLQLTLDRQQAESEPHRVRFLVSFLNVVVAASGVLVFYLLARQLVDRPDLAFLVTAVFAFGSLHWWYATTFFSEPLAELLTVVSLWLLVRGFRDRGMAMARLAAATAAAGLVLGLATAAHLSAVLFFPFFCAFAWVEPEPLAGRARRWWAAGSFAVGFSVPLVALLAFNLYRFGSWLETGRGVVSDAATRFGYGVWVPPWQGIAGLLASPGKGLLWFCPIVILGLIAMPAFARRRRWLFWLVIGSAAGRLLILAARSDWHGGFALGPRYLLLIVPLLLLPVAAWLGERPNRVRIGALLFAAIVAAAQQFYFVLGEVFFFYHSAWLFAQRRQSMELLEDIYFNWQFSPLLSLHHGARGPWLLRESTLPTSAWMAGFLSLSIVLGVVWFRLLAPRSEIEN